MKDVCRWDWPQINKIEIIVAVLYILKLLILLRTRQRLIFEDILTQKQTNFDLGVGHYHQTLSQFPLYQQTYRLQPMINKALIEQPIDQQIQQMPPHVRQRVQGLVKYLKEPIIQNKKIRPFLLEGIPDEVPLLRELTWKVVLGYLSRAKAKWPEQILKQEKSYNEFVKQYIPVQKYQNYPLNMNRSHPQWELYQKDFYMWEQIEKDTSRTQSELSFFSEEVPEILIPFLTCTRKEKYKMINGNNEQVLNAWLNNKQEQRKTYRYDYMTRILFIFAKANPKAEYVQGMNEVLAPIFFMVNSKKKGKIDEAACFFMFNNVMADLIQLNIEAFDTKQNGIHARIQQINKVLLAVEPRIWYTLNRLKIDPLFYSFRWLTLLFAQDFQLFQILRIWEAIFSYEDRSVFVNYFAVSLISSIKQLILNGDYSQILMHLRRIREHIKLNDVIFRAAEMYHEMKGVDISALAQNNYKKLTTKQKKNGQSTKTKILAKFMKIFI